MDIDIDSMSNMLLCFMVQRITMYITSFPMHKLDK